MSLTGLEETKAFFLHAKAKIQAASRRDTGLKKENFDVVFLGNEGTGKSAMARLYAKFLASMGLVKPTATYSGIEYFSSYGFGKSASLSTMRNTCDACGGCVSDQLGEFTMTIRSLIRRNFRLPLLTMRTFLITTITICGTSGFALRNFQETS
jgi:hypothetical protein